MDEMFKQIPAVIEQAAKSPLGLLVLMVLALSFLGFFFFRNASETTRLIIFLLLFLGTGTLGYAVLKPLIDTPSRPTKPDDTPVAQPSRPPSPTPTSCPTQLSKHKEGNGAYVEFTLQQAAHGETRRWKDGYHTRYIFPTCRGIGWKNIAFTCNNGVWNFNVQASYYNNAWCHGSYNDSQRGMRLGVD